MNSEDQRIINDYFKTLEDWKLLPAYKLETRIDSIVGFALPEIIKDVKGYSVKAVIPELPLRVGTLLYEDKKRYDKKKWKQIANKSNKVDFYVLTECHKNLFIEFKSDIGSLNDGQNGYLKKAKKCGMEKILDGIIKIASVTTYKNKYEHLLGKLNSCGLITGENGNIHPSAKQSIIDLIYILPTKPKKDIKQEIIYYETLADSISRSYKGSEMMERFASSIIEWSND